MYASLFSFVNLQEIDVRAGGGKPITMGELCRHFLERLEWFDTRFPRIPVNVQVCKFTTRVSILITALMEIVSPFSERGAEVSGGDVPGRVVEAERDHGPDRGHERGGVEGAAQGAARGGRHGGRIISPQVALEVEIEERPAAIAFPQPRQGPQTVR